MKKHRQHRVGVGAAAALFVLGVGAGVHAVDPPETASAATVVCGGQAWNAQAPLTCTHTRVIDGTSVTITLHEDSTGAASVVYSFATPRSTPTLLHVLSHTGISSLNGPVNEVRGTMPVGATSATLVFQARCGQVDIRAVFDNKAGRVSGPFISNGSCAPPVTTTTVPSTPPTTSGTTTATTAATTTVPVSMDTQRITSHTLPATGSGTQTAETDMALAVIVVGLLLWALARRRKGRQA